MAEIKAQFTTYAESCIPPLKSGEYEIHVTHESNMGTSETKKQKLIIDGPRFSLDHGAVNSVFPPEGISGRYASVLAHIVLNRKTLPWERSITTHKGDTAQANGGSPLMETPWMALLLFCEDEIPQVHAATVRDATSPESGIYFPKLSITDEEGGETCQYVDIDFDLFKKIAPSPEDLTYLCHARQVDPFVKANGEDLEPWLSVLVCNRLPRGEKQKAFVVSLEGYERVLQAATLHCAKVRLIVLHQWVFTNEPSTGHFYELAGNLSVKPLALEAKTTSDALNNIQQNGYVPVKHNMRNGDRSVSFYRGALCPAPVPKRDYDVTDADALYKYDPLLGMFDVSYAAAWQVGRLIALHNMSIALRIMKTRGENHRRTNSMQQREHLDGMIGLCAHHGAIGSALLGQLEDILERVL